MIESSLAEIDLIEDENTAPKKGAEGPACKKCGTAIKKSEVAVCRKCGYYEQLDTFLEVDADWEEDDDGSQPEKPSRSHLEVWMHLLPWWAWVLLGSVLAVVAESLMVRLVVPTEGGLRTLWSLSQLAVGFFAFWLLHVFVYVSAIMGSADFNLLDFVMRPLACWWPVVRKLPRTIGYVAAGAASLTAVIGSFVIIGALPYDRLWNWGIEPSARPNLLGAVVEQAKKVDAKDQSLEEAVGDLAGGEEEQMAPAESDPRVPVDCLVAGFVPLKDNPNDFRSLIMATEVGGRLKIIGFVHSGFSAEDREKLNARMRKLSRPTPFVFSTMEANWLEPRLTCKISCKGQSSTGMLIEPLFERMLADLDFGN